MQRTQLLRSLGLQLTCVLLIASAAVLYVSQGVCVRSMVLNGHSL